MTQPLIQKRTRSMQKLQILMLLTLSLSFFNQHLHAQKSDLKSDNATDLKGVADTGNEPPVEKLESTDSLLERMSYVVEEAGNDSNSMLKESRVDGQVIHLSLKGTEGWNVYLSFSPNRKYAYVVFPCRKVDLDSEAMETLLLENQYMGASRFELSNGELRITTPCELQELDAEKLNRMLLNNLSEARRTMSAWSQSSENVESNPAIESTPSAGSTPKLPELTEICASGELRMGTMELRSIKDKNFFGLISFAPDFTFAMEVQDLANDGKIAIKGTYQIQDGKLHLVAEQQGRPVRFTYLLESKDGDKMVLRSEDGGLDTITFN